MRITKISPRTSKLNNSIAFFVKMMLEAKNYLFNLFRPVKLLILILGIIVFSACKKDSPTNPAEISKDDLNTLIKSMPELQQTAEAPYEIVGNDTISDGDYICYTEIYSGSPGFSELIFSRTNSDILYPGALLDGQSVVDGSYTICPLKRAPVTLTTNLYGLSGEISKTVDSPSYSTIQTAVHEILSQKIIGDAGAEMNWEVTEVYNMAHFKAALGINVKIGDVFSASSQLDFSSKSSHRYVIAKYSQKYYDVIIDQPMEPSDFLDMEGVSVDVVKTNMGEVSPVYISTVSYGRFALFYFESTHLSFDLKAAVEGMVKISGNVNVETEGETGFNSVSEHTTCRAYILGGSGAAASASISDKDKFISFLKEGGNYSKDSPGKPISFTLRYLSNNKPAKIIMATEYEQTTCNNVANKYRVRLDSLMVKKITAGKRYTKFLKGRIDIYGGGSGNPQGGNTIYNLNKAENFTLGSYVSVGKSVDIEFEQLITEERQYAYIDIDVSDMRIYPFTKDCYFINPSFKRIFLHQIKVGDGSFVSITKDKKYELTQKYTIEVLE